MTDIKEIKTLGINQLATAMDGGQQVLLIGLKEAYRNKPQYNRYLKKEYEKNQSLDNQYMLKCISFKEIEPYGNCLEMEWQDARNITEYLAEGHGTDERKAVFRQIIEAVSYLHANHQVMAVLNPNNIFVTKKGDVVKVLNFSRRYADNLHEPNELQKYKAPEVKDETVAIDVRADLFSLGILLKDFQLGDDYEELAQVNCNLGRGQRNSDIDEFQATFEHRRTSTRSTRIDSEGSNSKIKQIILAAVLGMIIIISAITFFVKNSSEGTDETATEVADSTINGTTPKSQPAKNVHASQTAVPGQNPAYTGDNAFLAKLVPQMQKDVDRIYIRCRHRSKWTLHRKLGAYYRGLRRSLGNLNQQQYAAFDKAFAEYTQAKATANKASVNTLGAPATVSAAPAGSPANAPIQ